MAITPLPTPPSRSSPADFSTKADAFIAALPTFVTEANAVAAAMDLNDTTATSTTSLTIGTGAQSLTVDASKSYQVGMSVKIAHDSTNWMHGEVTSYNAGTGALVVNVTNIAGSGTEATWTVTLSGPIAFTGLTSSVAELNILDGVTASAAELNLIDGSVAGTAVASKALVLGANKEVDTLVIADGGLKLGSGAGTAIAATAAEINAACDVSGFTKLYAASGYQMLPGGMIIQMGTTGSVAGGGGTLAVTLPIAFPNSYGGMALTRLEAAGGVTATDSITSRSKSGFTVKNQDTVSHTYSYVIVGY